MGYHGVVCRGAPACCGKLLVPLSDVVEEEMTLTSRNPVMEVVARTSGRVSSLYVADGQSVKGGLPLVVVENVAVTEDVLRLKKLLVRYASEAKQLSYYWLQDVWQLGGGYLFLLISSLFA